MNVPLRYIVDSYEELSELFNTPMKSSVALRMSDIVTNVKNEFDRYEKKRIDTIMTLGEEYKDEKGVTQTEVPAHNFDKFKQEMDAFSETEVSVCDEKIPLSTLIASNGNEIDISPKCLSKLRWLIS